MARSTAKFISYDLRPAKQSERRILMDVLRTAGECGLALADYRYVGMGAVKFYDFLLVHRYLGIKKMMSLEHDTGMFNRAQFNVPYGFIEVKNETTSDFLATDALEGPTVIWFDYDGGLGPHILSDVTAMGLKLKQCDFCFVTVYGGPPRVLEKLNDPDRLAWFQDTLGDVAGSVTVQDVQNSCFSTAVHKVLQAAFKNAFAARRDGVFKTLLQVEYSDSVPMVTFGGAFLAEGFVSGISQRISTQIPFLKLADDELYEIASFHVTEQERVLFDRAVTKRGHSAERNRLRKLGFKNAEIAAYRDLVRYLPRYVEAIV